MVADFLHERRDFEQLLALVADERSNMLPEGARGEVLGDVAAQLGEFSALVGDLVALTRDDHLQRPHELVDLAFTGITWPRLETVVARQVKLPEGYRLAWGGQFENQQRAAARLMVVVPVALLLIFFLLFSTFGSVRQALLVLSNIPFAMIGGIFGLLISGEYLSVPASVGFIALLGIAVLNGVVMVTYFNQLLARGMSLAEVVVEGARRRLRPVMMTASIAAFGLVPMLFASGPGSEVQRPLAIVVIGGLLSSTALTLVLLPILFRRFGLEPKAAHLEKPRG